MSGLSPCNAALYPGCMTNETPMCQCGKAAIDFAHDMPSSNLFNHEVVPTEEVSQ